MDADPCAAPLQARGLLPRMAQRSKMSIFGIAGAGNSYEPRRPSIVELLSKSKKKMQKFQETGVVVDSDEEEEDDESDMEFEEEAFQSRKQSKREGLKDCCFESSKMWRQLSQAPEESGFFNYKDAVRLARLLKAAGDGSVLRGWRYRFDNGGNLNIPFLQFCRIALDIGFVKRVDELYCMPREFTNISLTQVNPQLGGLLESFRRWILLRYHGHASFFDSIDREHHNEVTEEGFINSCLSEGFSAQQGELKEIYACCDWQGNGVITRDDIVYLEHDTTVREREMEQIRLRKRYEFDKYLSDNYTQEMVNPLPPAHRQAIRPWIARQFEERPEIQRKCKAIHEKNRLRKGLEMRLEFIRLLRKMHGNEITAWRRMMDTEGKFSVTEARFRKVCRSIDFCGNVNALWYSFEPDHNGTIPLEKLSPHAADVLASFRAWAVNTFGCCAALWQSPECIALRTMTLPHREDEKVVSKHMRVPSFCQLLSSYECSVVQGEPTLSKAIRRFITNCLDLGGGGFILRSDLEWLDKWEPSAWLAAEPDEGAWLALHEVLLQKYGHLSKAWRFDLDVEGFNRLSWLDFRGACHRLKFDGDAGAAWRWLDKDLSGWLSLASIDPESSTILESFKEWAETRFASVKSAFETMAGGSTNTQITCHDLRIVTHKYKWPGDARILFECLTGNQVHVCYKDAAFLRAWKMADNENADLLRRTMETLWKEIMELKPAVRKQAEGANEGPELKALEPLILDLLAKGERVVECRGISSAPPCPYAARVVTSVWGSIGQRRTRRSNPNMCVIDKSSSHPPLPSRDCRGICSDSRLGQFSKTSGPERKRDLVGSKSSNASLEQDTVEYM